MIRMIIRLWRGLCFCLLGLAAIAPAQAEQHRVIRVGLFDMPPFYSQDRSGQPQGELITILNQVMDQLGYRWQPRFMPVPQALRGVVNGDVDLLMIIRHPMVEGKARYGNKPMGSMDLQAFHRRDSRDISDLGGLRGQRVALLRGYGYGGLLNQLLTPASGLKVHVAADHRDAFELLASKQVDYVLDYRVAGGRAIAELGLQNIDSDPLQKKEIYFVLSNKVAGGARLMRQLEDAMSEPAF